jgi:sugar transferase (PEP-CTERM/EpsH1 system associated)
MTPRVRMPPLVAHVIHHLGTGGMENGLIHLVNRTPSDRYRHAIVSLTDIGPFAARIMRPDVPLVSLHREPGHSFRLYWRLCRALRRLRPSVVHTRNLAALEGQIPALCVPGARRVHGEHGRDVFDLDGSSRKYNLLRRTLRLLVQRYIAVSRDLEGWLIERIGVNPSRVRQIYNGVALDAFRPREGVRPDIAPPGFVPPDGLVVGTVGRLAEVKDQATLVLGFAALIRKHPEWEKRLRLVIVGDGPSRQNLEACIQNEQIGSLVWLTGNRDDVPVLLRMLDLFVMTSLGEGTSNTILEAMASGLPVIATGVGGNPELVDEGISGRLVPPAEPAALAEAIEPYALDRSLGPRQGNAGLAKVSGGRFCWERCVEEYLSVYDELLGRG